MIFFFDAKGDLIRALPESIKQGSNRSSRLWFFMPTAPTNIVNAYFTLPNGELAEPVIMTSIGIIPIKPNVDFDTETYSAWFCDIPKRITQYAGTLDISFDVASPKDEDFSEESITTSSVQLSVLKGVFKPLNIEKTYTYEELMSYLASIQEYFDTHLSTINLVDYQKKTDENLNTDNKDIVGAVNEVNALAISNNNKITLLVNELEQQKYFAVVEDVENTKEIRQTADGEINGITVVDNSYTTVQKIQGDTVKSENLIDVPETFSFTQAKSIKISLSAGTYTLHSNGYTAGGENAPTLQIMENGTQLRFVAVPKKTTLNLTGGEYTFTFYSNGYSYQDSAGITSKIHRLMLNRGDTALPYQAYFTDLKNAKISGIKSVGRNLFNSALLAEPNGWENIDGVYTGAVRDLQQMYTIDKGGMLKIGKEGQITVSFIGKNHTKAGRTIGIKFNYTDGTSYTYYPIMQTTYAKYSESSDANKIVDVISIGYSEGDTIYLKEFCVKIGDDETYEPYTESVMTLPETELGKWDYIQNGLVVKQTIIESFDASKFNFETGAYNGTTDFILSNDNKTIVYKAETPTITGIAFDNKYLVWDKGQEIIQSDTFEYGAKLTITNDYMIYARFSSEIGGAE